MELSLEGQEIYRISYPVANTDLGLIPILMRYAYSLFEKDV